MQHSAYIRRPRQESNPITRLRVNDANNTNLLRLKQTFGPLVGRLSLDHDKQAPASEPGAQTARFAFVMYQISF